ncbi:hypothetical protein PHO31112_04839 [Pandoraea horticolens]|uniref:DUF2267 domain-containing protein n=1 Tax=Pandoraea horticolens TaxID=2508298 RepID=A0A5E4YWB2_9BURK|nr:DUF2267 domain-containing protein [Pandoraea horticolens]VVE53224.1 hypothetical protein PHO31112_04839 [Pandoraea horticolens]
MPLPFEYQNPTLQFERFMLDARDCAGLATTNMAWNMVVGVLHTYRRRLTVQQIARFCSVLPPVVRALFIEGWDPDQPILEFGSDAQLLEEVRSVRRQHNFSPINAIASVAEALRRNIDVPAFDLILSEMPDGSTHYWQGIGIAP